MKNKNLKVGIALLAVAAIGAFAGILLAPEEGSKTRKKLSKKGKKLWNNAKATAEDVAGKAHDLKDKAMKEGERLFG